MECTDFEDEDEDEVDEYLREHRQQDVYLPEEIQRMDSRSQKLYLKALETGEIKVHNIRVMVVGHFGVGKSTLTKRLLGEDVDINARNSTEGIDVHVKRCRVDLETGMWKVNAKDTFRDDSTARIAHVVQQEVSKIGIAENPIEKASYYDGKTSLETSSNNDSTGLSDPPSGFQSTDLKQNTKGTIHTRAEGVVYTSSSSQIEEDLKLLVQRSYDKEMREITHYADLSIWDFAGQSDFYGTHQMFLSPRSVYILVIDLSQTIDSLVLDDTCCLDAHGERKMKISDYQKQMIRGQLKIWGPPFPEGSYDLGRPSAIRHTIEFVEFWLQSIYFYTKGGENVILVGTHAGELPEEGREEHINTIFDNLRSHLCDKPFSICLSDNDFAIDNRIVDPKLEDLKSAIFRVAESKKDYWGERIPARWLTLERELNEMRRRGEKIIEYHVFEKTNEMLSSSLPQEELNLFLRFYHACGLLLFFSEDNLRDFIILDSQWLIDAFKCFITADMFMKKNVKLVQLWKKFKDSCVLTKEFVDASWDHSNDKRFLKYKVHLLQLMEKLDIIARPVTYPDDDGHQNNSKILEGDYFTPCMLKEKPPTILLNTSNSKSTSRLCYTYSCTSDPDSGFVPPAVFHRLLAACMARWQPRNDKKKTLLFSGFGMFDLDSSRTEALTLYLRDDIIQMWITNFGSFYPNVDTCIKTRDTVESLLQKVCSMQNITTCIKCPETDCSSSEGMIEISHFRDCPEYCCPMHEEPELKDHIIQSAQVLRHWDVIETAGSPESHTSMEKKIMDVGNCKEWDEAITDKDEERLGRLLNINTLPSPDQLRKVCEVFDKESPVVHRMCSEISRTIQSLDYDVIKVIPSYRPAFQNDVIFELYIRYPRERVVTYEHGYTVILKVLGQYTNEGKYIADMEINKGSIFSLDQNIQLNQCLEKYSESLMNTHSNLQMISASHFKSRRYGHRDPPEDPPEETTCIVFFVRFKGYIPVGEESLPDHLDGIPTDVREGGFEFLSKTSDQHVNLKMGCEIAGNLINSSGTLGPFFKHNDNVYGLTAAHVLYNVPEHAGTPTELPSKQTGQHDINVYQPSPLRVASIFEKEHFGSVYCAMYKQGDSENPGIDVAVIEITDKSRFPNSGEFPGNAHGSQTGDATGSLEHLRYNTGKICEQSFLQQCPGVEVLKFGAVTGGTRGLLHFDGTSVRNDCVIQGGGRVLLYKQLEITRYVNQTSFAELGDSGSVVLVPNCGNRNDLMALGLLVGQSSTGSILASPLYAILDELKVNPTARSFMKFPNDGLNPVDNVAEMQNLSYLKPTFEAFEKKMMEHESEMTGIRSELGSLKSTVGTMNSHINDLKHSLKNLPDQIVQSMQQGGAKQNQHGDAL